MEKFLDKHGSQIKNGLFLKLPNGTIEKVILKENELSISDRSLRDMYLELQDSEIVWRVILVERDYKGNYERFALTVDEFAKEYPELWQRLGNTAPTEAGTHTVRFLEHIWYCPTVIGDPTWYRFFSNMTCGLPQSDIEEGNYAYVRFDLAKLLRNIIKSYGKCNDFVFDCTW